MKKLTNQEIEKIVEAVKDVERDCLENHCIEEAVIVSADGSVRIEQYAVGSRSMPVDVWRGEAQVVYSACHEYENVWDMYDDPAEEFELCLEADQLDRYHEIIKEHGFSAPKLSSVFPEAWENFVDFAIDTAITVIDPVVWQDDDGEITVMIDYN